MSLNIAETFELLFDKNNNVAYKADISVYDDSMQALVSKDIQKALQEIRKL